MKKEEQKFETIISQLETIVRELDSSLGLEESLNKYEQGMVLAKLAEERLKTIENQFQKIQEQFAIKDVTLKGPLEDNSAQFILQE